MPPAEAASRRRHALVVGGTGMLLGCTRRIAESSARLTAVARTERSLARLAEACGPAADVRTVALDYRDGAALRAALDAAIAADGPIDLALLWIHAVAPDAPRVVCEALGEGGAPARVFRVLGSASAAPGSDRPRPPVAPERFPRLAHRSVVLGFVREGGRSRWLTHAEIADGVWTAVRDDLDGAVIGTTTPWEERP